MSECSSLSTVDSACSGMNHLLHFTYWDAADVLLFRHWNDLATMKTKAGHKEMPVINFKENKFFYLQIYIELNMIFERFFFHLMTYFLRNLILQTELIFPLFLFVSLLYYPNVLWFCLGWIVCTSELGWLNKEGWVGYVAHMGEKRNVYNIWDWKPWEENHLQDLDVYGSWRYELDSSVSG